MARTGKGLAALMPGFPEPVLGAPAVAGAASSPAVCTHVRSGLQRILPIEGLRAWLAWAVVFSYICDTLNWFWLTHIGDDAVRVFIVISGFVICGLVCDKPEPWRVYIVRRAFRIFPAYLVAYALALAVLPAALASFEHESWANAPGFQYDDLVRSWAQAMTDHPWIQNSLHLTLLQGVVPDSTLPFTSMAVLGTAWSLTLEWQFYLVAPAFIWCLATKRFRIATVVIVFAALIAFRQDVFGKFIMPAFLPGAGHIFMVGIGCRLAAQSLKHLSLGPEFTIAALGFGLIFPDARWLAIWVAFFSFVLYAESWTSPRLTSVGKAMFQSRPALFLGARSYSVFLLHLPIIQLMTWAIVTRGEVSKFELFLGLAVLVPLVTLITSEMLFRCVERPMIRIGARLASATKAGLSPPSKSAPATVSC
jgi:peptidoglycan/LPS O-acetylase OafA/YrhL